MELSDSQSQFESETRELADLIVKYVEVDPSSDLDLMEHLKDELAYVRKQLKRVEKRLKGWSEIALSDAQLDEVELQSAHEAHATDQQQRIRFLDSAARLEAAIGVARPQWLQAKTRVPYSEYLEGEISRVNDDAAEAFKKIIGGSLYDRPLDDPRRQELISPTTESALTAFTRRIIDAVRVLDNIQRKRHDSVALEYSAADLAAAFHLLGTIEGEPLLGARSDDPNTQRIYDYFVRILTDEKPEFSRVLTGSDTAGFGIAQ